MNKRYICNYTVYNSRLYINSVISISKNGQIDIRKYDDEVAFTEYIEGIIYITYDSEHITQILNFMDATTSPSTNDTIDFLKKIHCNRRDIKPIILQIIPSKNIIHEIKH